MMQGDHPQAPFGHDPGDPDPLAPARKASVLMVILGGLILALGLCNSITSMMTPADDLARAQVAMGARSAYSADTYRLMAAVAGVLQAIVGAAMIALAFPIRRGARVATIISLVLAAALALLALAFSLGGILLGLAAPPMFIIGCAGLALLALTGPLIFWLVRALRFSTRARAPFAVGWPHASTPPWQQAHPGSPHAPPPPPAGSIYGSTTDWSYPTQPRAAHPPAQVDPPRVPPDESGESDRGDPGSQHP